MITGMPRIAIATRDFDGIIKMFRDRLGMPVIDIRDESINSLGAALAFCTPDAGSNIEIMAPGNPNTPLSQSLERFLDRRGQGHFALMLEAAEPNEEAQGLLERGLNVMPLMEGAGGRDIHPNSTHGVLIRVYPTNSFTGKGEIAGSESVNPDLGGIERVLIAVQDIDAAADTYGRKFEMEISGPFEDEEAGVRRVICAPPTGGVIELVEPAEADKTFAAAIREFLDDRGEGLYALVLSTDNIKASTSALKERGISITGVPGLSETFEIDPAQTFGARIWIE